MIETAREKAASFKTKINILEMDAEKMSFDDNSFDSVVTSCVFCSVPNPVRGLKEIRRVSRPGGKILMLELHIWE